MSNPVISFVIPVYNKVAYLAECLDSIRRNTLKNIEIVVVDDGSVDSLDYLKRFYTKLDERISWYTLDTNKGRSYARNYGNKMAKADIIAVQDADDVCTPIRATVINEYFQSCPDVDVFYSAFNTVDFYGRKGDTVEAIEFNIDNVIKTKTTFIGHSTMAYRKKAVLDVKYDEGEYSRLGLDDWKLQMDLYHKGYKFGCVNKVLVDYRLLSDSITIVRDATEVYKQKGLYFDSLKEKTNG